MSETEQPLWDAVGWVGPAAAIDPFKRSLNAHVSGTEIGAMNPQVGRLADFVDDDDALVGFVLSVRPSYHPDVPAGVFGMKRHVAAALLSTLTSGRGAEPDA